MPHSSQLYLSLDPQQSLQMPTSTPVVSSLAPRSASCELPSDCLAWTFDGHPSPPLSCSQPSAPVPVLMPLAIHSIASRTSTGLSHIASLLSIREADRGRTLRLTASISACHCSLTIKSAIW